MPEPVTCPVCRQPIPAGAPEGFCPQCFLAGALTDAGDGTAAAPAAAAARLGEYELLEEIARGGQGAVYRAREPVTGRIVALKRLTRTWLEGEAAARRFRMEVEAAAGLDHPNILRVFHVGEAEGEFYFTMPMVEGGSLARGPNSTEQSGRRPGDVAGLMTRIARAVQHAHERGIIHRDIKPSNILMDSRGEPLVADFGLAKRIGEADAAAGPGLTRSGAALGTPLYWSPEQARGDSRHVTTAADVYGLGAVLYEMLTGSPPFRPEDEFQLRQRVIESEPERPRSLNGAIDGDLETICLKCLEKDPARRYLSAAALADDLERWARGEAILARPQSAVYRLRKWARKHPALAALWILGLTAPPLILTVWGWSERRHARAVEAAHAVTLEQRYAAELGAAGEAVLMDNPPGARRILDALAAPEFDRLRDREYDLLRVQTSDGSRAVLGPHPGPVTAVAWEGDGQHVVTAGEQFVWRWNALTGVREVLPLATDLRGAPVLAAPAADMAAADSSSLPNGTDGLHDVALLAVSNDGAYVAVAGRERGVRVWRRDGAIAGVIAATAAQVAFVEGHTLVAAGTVSGTGGGAVAVNADTRQAASLPPDTGGKIAAAKGVLALLTKSGALQVWPWPLTAKPLLDRQPGDPASDPWAQMLPGAAALSVAPPADDGSLVVAWRCGPGAFSPHKARTYASRGNRLSTSGWFSAGSMVSAAALSPDGKWLAAASTSEIFTAAGPPGGVMATLHGHEQPVLATAFSPDGRTLATASQDGSVRIWKGSSFRRRFSLPDAPVWAAAGQQVVLSPDGRHAAPRFSPAPVVHEWRAGRQEALSGAGEVLALTNAGAALRLTVSPDQSVVLEWRMPGQPEASGRTVPDGAGRGSPALCAASAGGGRFAAVWNAGPAALWDAESGVRLAELPDSLTRLDFSPDGDSLAVAGSDEIRIIETASGKLSGRMRLPESGLRLTALAPLPGGAGVIAGVMTAAGRPELRRWDAGSRQWTGPAVLEHAVTSLQAASSRLVATTGMDGRVSLWRLDLGGDHAARRVCTLGRGLSGSFLTWSAGGAVLACPLGGQSVLFWPLQPS